MPHRPRPRATQVCRVERSELDPIDPDAVHDDDEDTDHLARLEHPPVLYRVKQLDADIDDRHGH